MRKTFYIVFLFTSAILFCKAGLSQDAGFSQFYANPIYLNPALTGNRSNPTLSLNYRNQWPSLQSSFTTYAASWDQHFDVSVTSCSCTHHTACFLVDSLYGNPDWGK